jgi:L-Ala-D/L-Glu epimerase
VKLDFKHLDLRLTHKWTIARAPGTNIFKVIVVELTGTVGLSGIGEAAPIIRYNESVDSVEAFLRKLDPRKLSFDDIAGSMNYLNTVSTADMAAKCAVNMALLDGAAKRARMPIFDFVGLGFRESQHLTSFSIGIDKPDVIAKKVLAADAFPVLKMKVGVPEDKELLRALRAVAPAKPVRVDANEGWGTKEHALEMIEWLAADRHIQFVEQPLPASASLKDWAWLKQRSPLPIFADESYHSAKDVERVAECFHGVNVKLVKAGGISGAFEALQAARRLGLKTMLGCMIETSVLISAAAHLVELCDYLDLDGNLLITNDPYVGVTAEKGMLSFANAPETFGLRVTAR